MTDPLITAAQFLTTQLDWLRHATDEQRAPVAVDVFREIGECAARMRSITDGPRDQRYLGPCGAEVLECAVCQSRDPDHHAGHGPDCEHQIGVEVECDGDVYGIPGA